MATPSFSSRFSQSFTINNKLCILSATEDGVRVGASEELGCDFHTYPGGVFIFTEKLAAYAPLDSHGAPQPAMQTSGSGVLNVSARTLSAFVGQQLAGARDSVNDARLCRLSADGRDGVNNAAGAKDDAIVAASNGGPGGSMAVYVQDCDLQSILDLGLSARGGAGATTGNLDVAAGTGGDAGSVTFFGRPALTKIVALVSAFETKQGIPLKWTDAMKARAKKIAPSHPIFRALADLLLELVRSASDWEIQTDVLIRIVAPLHELSVAAGQERTALMIWRACNKTRSNVVMEIDSLRQTFWGNVDVRGGDGGRATVKSAEERGINGSNGQDGSKTVVFDDGTEQVCPSSVVAHPAQCKMVLDKAKALFYLDDPESRKRAIALLDGILLRLAVVPDGPAKDTAEWQSVLKQYSQNIDIYGIPVDKIEETLRAIKDEARTLSMQLISGVVDCYGHRSDWAPRLSVMVLKNSADTALERLKEIEKSTAECYDAFRSRTQLNDRVSDQRAAMRKSSAELDQASDQLEERLSVLAKTINDKVVLGQINDKRIELRAHLDQIADKIRTEFKIGPSTIIKGLEMCAFSPEAPMIALQAGSALYTGYTSIPDDSDTPVQREVILKKIPSNFASVVESVPADSDDGTLAVDQKGYNLLLIQRDAFADSMSSFSKSSWADSATAATAAMDAFTTLVATRNAAIVEYNFTQSTLRANRAAAQSLLRNSDAIERLSHSPATPTALQQDAAALAALLLDTARARAMRTIALLQRAIAFSALSGATDLLAGLSAHTESVLEMSYPVLRDRADRLADVLLASSERAGGGDGSTFPPNLAPVGRGKRLALSAAQVAALLETGTVDVVVPPVYRGGAGGGDFRDCADVRVYRVRAWLEGLKLREGVREEQLVKVDVAHGGRSTFVTAEDDEYVFAHEPAYVSWSYRLGVDGARTVVDSGDVVVLDGAAKERTKYAAPGVAATWTVGIKSLVRDGLDMASITGCTLEFWGNNYAFVPSDKATRRGRRAGGGVARVDGEDLSLL